MSGPWWLSWRTTNLGLFAVLAVVFATGVGAVATGSARGAWVVVAHEVAGLVVLAFLPWKRRVAAAGLARRRPGRWASVLLAVLVVGAIIAGVVSVTGVFDTIAGQYPLWWHIAMALAALPLLVWHVAGRRIRPRRTDLGRRTAVRVSAVAAAGGTAWLITEGALRAGAAPGASRRFTGSHPADPAAMPVTSWIDDPVLRIRPADWRLTVRDADGARVLTVADLDRLAPRIVRATLDCTSGWYATQDWTGVPLTALLRPAREHRSVLVRSRSGYARLLPLSELDGLLLATGFGGAPLRAGHGFPARLVAPGRRGFWWVKWVDGIELSRCPWWLQSPFPLT